MKNQSKKKLHEWCEWNEIGKFWVFVKCLSKPRSSRVIKHHSKKQTLPIKHRSVTARDSRRWRGARRRTRRWARCRCWAALSRRGSSARFRLRFRCPSSSRSCLQAQSRVSDTNIRAWTSELTFLGRAVLVPRVQRRLRVLILVDFGRGCWNYVSGNWRAWKRWRGDCVRRSRLARRNFRLQRANWYRWQRVIFLFPTNEDSYKLAWLKTSRMASGRLHVRLRLFFRAVGLAVLLLLAALLGLCLLATTAKKAGDCSAPKGKRKDWID